MNGKGDANTRVDMAKYKDGKMAKPFWDNISQIKPQATTKPQPRRMFIDGAWIEVKGGY